MYVYTYKRLQKEFIAIGFLKFLIQRTIAKVIYFRNRDNGETVLRLYLLLTIGLLTLIKLREINLLYIEYFFVDVPLFFIYYVLAACV